MLLEKLSADISILFISENFGNVINFQPEKHFVCKSLFTILQIDVRQHLYADNAIISSISLVYAAFDRGEDDVSLLLYLVRA